MLTILPCITESRFPALAALFVPPTFQALAANSFACHYLYAFVFFRILYSWDQTVCRYLSNMRLKYLVTFIYPLIYSFVYYLFIIIVRVCVYACMCVCVRFYTFSFTSV